MTKTFLNLLFFKRIMDEVDNKINKLPNERRKEFDQNLNDVMYSKKWLQGHKIDSSNPYLSKVKKELYKEMIEGDKSYFTN